MKTKPFSILAAIITAGTLIFAAAQPVSANAPIPAQQAEGLGPVETMRFLGENMANKRADALWVLLPSSYQTEITSLVHEFAKSVDPDVYQRSADLMKKLVKVFKDKREFILGSPLVAGMLEKDRGEIEPAYNAVIEFFEILLNSEVGDLDSLKQVNIGEMLAGTGSKLLHHIEQAGKLLDDSDPLSQFRDANFELISQAGDSATVKVTSVEMDGDTAIETTTEVSMTKVEGKWVEEEIAESFQENMKEAREAVGEMDWQEGKMMALTMISGMDSSLDELLATRSSEEFTAAIMKLIGGFMGEF